MESNTWGKSFSIACLPTLFTTHPCKPPVQLCPNHPTEAGSQRNFNAEGFFLDSAGGAVWGITHMGIKRARSPSLGPPEALRGGVLWTECLH